MKKRGHWCLGIGEKMKKLESKGVKDNFSYSSALPYLGYL